MMNKLDAFFESRTDSPKTKQRKLDIEEMKAKAQIANAEA